MSLQLYVFDEGRTLAWDPFILTRPVGELLFGAILLRERTERFWGSACRGHLTHPHLAGFVEGGSPPVVELSASASDESRILMSSRAVLRGAVPRLPQGPCTLMIQGEVAGWYVPEGSPGPDPGTLSTPRALPGSERLELEGILLAEPWDLMSRNAHQLREDIPSFYPGYAADELPGCHILGDGLLSLGSRVEVEPGSLFDTTKGPIRLADDVTVRAPTRLEGPAFIGPGSTVLGGSLSGVSVGPVCKVRGEVEESVILGYTNKAHDGFIGHAYLGRWVNLGAMTTNSDLKNNYGPVRVGGPDGPRETGILKVGCFLGDHVKTGIGTFLNTGTVVGAGSNLFGGGMPPTYVPPFSWGAGADLTEFRLESFLDVAVRAMERRDVAMDPAMEDLLRRAWEATRFQRHPSVSS